MSGRTRNALLTICGALLTAILILTAQLVTASAISKTYMPWIRHFPATATPSPTTTATPSPTAPGGTTIIGSGNVIRQNRDARGFNAVELRSVGRVVLTQGTAESVAVESDDNIVPVITTEVSGGVLVISVKPGVSISTNRGLTIYVTAVQLRALTISGAGSIGASGLNLSELGVTLSGAGRIETSGTVATQRVTLSGAGRYDGCALRSADATVNLSGGGSVVIQASATLNITLNGAGSVSYLGNPAVQQTITGAGFVRQIDSCPTA